ncbi:MAG: hypothetical protein ABI988_19490 [Nitrospirota bacterium]
MDKETQEPKKLKTGCPWCGLTLRVGRDKKQRPFWRCWRCEVRCFGTETTLERFEGDGWIWSGERPLEAVKAWLRRLGDEIGLKPKKGK